MTWISDRDHSVQAIALAVRDDMLIPSSASHSAPSIPGGEGGRPHRRGALPSPWRSCWHPDRRAQPRGSSPDPVRRGSWEQQGGYFSLGEGEVLPLSGRAPLSRDVIRSGSGRNGGGSGTGTCSGGGAGGSLS